MHRYGHTFRGSLVAISRELLPPVCPICRAVLKPLGRVACDPCLAALERLSTPRCPTCGGMLDSALDQCAECLRLPARPWQHAVSSCRFSGLARHVVHRFKYSKETYLGPVLADMMASDWVRHGPGRPDVVVPIPLHWTKRVTRGYNQSGLLARLVGRRLQAPCCRGLRRRRRTRQQAMLDFDARQRNMADVFAPANIRALAGRHVLLVDDVLTTGATLAAAAQALRAEGVDNISVLTVARG